MDGRTRAFDVRTDETLLETLRDRCGTTSVRYCCGIGVCGTCTVLLDGDAVSSCLLLTVMAEGRQVTTPQGLAATSCSAISSAQQAFVDAGAFQCSYCIPGMALAAQAAIDRDPEASVDHLVDELAGNLCRCGSYPQVREALERLVSGPTDDTATTPEEVHQ
ncbi:(2Fe-2S)-binding protein [Blastococcus saxobsidens]|uniref:(2Fe-2S)-binding protein n=1 Tax=Blastococcus saxobsidens TaxID=138336 RepID=UPI001A9330B7|nr:2Fe-2S iron-sulfur cluster-binding protein [Blastococcus saxobsidens]